MGKRSLDEKRSELEAIGREIEADRRQRLLRDEAHRKARHLRRLALEREVAAADGLEYADAAPLSMSIGDEWHLVSTSGDTVLICGDVGAPTSSLVCFHHAEEVVWRADNDDLDGSAPHRGLDVYGLFRIHNSEWKRDLSAAMLERSLHFDEAWWDGFEHFVVRGKGGELSCLARNYTCQQVNEPIETIRHRMAFWRILL